jgi:hypothetical protein
MLTRENLLRELDWLSGHLLRLKKPSEMVGVFDAASSRLSNSIRAADRDLLDNQLRVLGRRFGVGVQRVAACGPAIVRRTRARDLARRFPIG